MIKLIVVNQELSIVTSRVVSGTHNYLTLEAEFKGDAWTGLRKWVHFTMGDFNYIMPLLNDAIAADQHLDLTEGTWEVYVHGNLSDDDAVTERVTTDIKYLYVDAPFDGHPFPPLTPTYEEMLANQCAEAKEISEQLREDAEAGLFADGATFYPDVDEEGIISWTNDKGRENPDPANIRGPQGETGESGVYIGTTEPTDPDIRVWIDPTGEAGKLITSVETTGTHAAGTTDTYKLNFSDGTYLTITVYNGADGSGAGDMLKSAYDTTNKAQDVYAYADSKAASEAAAAAAAVKDKTAQTGLLKGSSGLVVAAVAGTDYVAPSSLADVATTGAYNDLSGKPSLATVATSGAYSDLSGKPNLATVATSGSYNDLSNKPVIPSGLTVDPALSNSSTNPVQNKVVKQAIDGITTRPNPYSLQINVDGNTTTYDGSEAKAITISTAGSSGDKITTRVLELGTVTVAANAEEVCYVNYEYSGYTALAIIEVKLTYGNDLVPVYWGKVTEQNGMIRVWNKGNSSYSGKPGYVRVLYKKNS